MRDIETFLSGPPFERGLLSTCLLFLVSVVLSPAGPWVIVGSYRLPPLKLIYGWCALEDPIWFMFRFSLCLLVRFRPQTRVSVVILFEGCPNHFKGVFLCGP